MCLGSDPHCELPDHPRRRHADRDADGGREREAHRYDVAWAHFTVGLDVLGHKRIKGIAEARQVLVLRESLTAERIERELLLDDGLDRGESGCGHGDAVRMPPRSVLSCCMRTLTSLSSSCTSL